ncbi:MAG TPA: hypothetical protein DCM87_13685 [Planctomycetes bacterium]|nr:hypothetical protein [Planctomycetota bacterium]
MALSMRMADETVQGRSNVRQGASDAASRRALLVPVPINLNTSVERDEESAGLKIYSGEFSNCGRIVDRTYESLIKSTCGETGVLDLFAEGRLYAPLNGTRARVFLIDMDAARTSAPRQAVSAETEDYGVPVEDPHLPPQLSFVLNPINEGFVFANATMKWDSRRYSIWTEGGGEHPFSLVPEGAGKRAGQPRRLVVYSGGFNIMSSRD